MSIRSERPRLALKIARTNHNYLGVTDSWTRSVSMTCSASCQGAPPFHGQERAAVPQKASIFLHRSDRPLWVDTRRSAIAGCRLPPRLLGGVTFVGAALNNHKRTATELLLDSLVRARQQYRGNLDAERLGR